MTLFRFAYKIESLWLEVSALLADTLLGGRFLQPLTTLPTPYMCRYICRYPKKQDPRTLKHLHTLLLSYVSDW